MKERLGKGGVDKATAKRENKDMTLLIIILLIVAVGVGVWYVSRRRPAERDFGGQAKPKSLVEKPPIVPKPFEAPKPPTPPAPPFPPSQNPPTPPLGGGGTYKI